MKGAIELRLNEVRKSQADDVKRHHSKLLSSTEK